MKKKILLISGDPISINSEIIYKSWKKLSPSLKKQIYLIGNIKLLKVQFKKLKYPIKIIKVKSINDKTKENHLKIINIDINFKKPFDIS